MQSLIFLSSNYATNTGQTGVSASEWMEVEKVTFLSKQSLVLVSEMHFVVFNSTAN